MKSKSFLKPRYKIEYNDDHHYYVLSERSFLFGWTILGAYESYALAYDYIAEKAHRRAVQYLDEYGDVVTTEDLSPGRFV